VTRNNVSISPRLWSLTWSWIPHGAHALPVCPGVCGIVKAQAPDITNSATRPAKLFNVTRFYAQGLNIGVEVRF
jgi:hypothetical protein